MTEIKNDKSEVKNEEVKNAETQNVEAQNAELTEKQLNDVNGAGTSFLDVMRTVQRKAREHVPGIYHVKN